MADHPRPLAVGSLGGGCGIRKPRKECTVETFHTKGCSKIFLLIFLLFLVRIVVLIPKRVLKIFCVAIAPYVKIQVKIMKYSKVKMNS
jgi:hypothetical protein